MTVTCSFLSEMQDSGNRLYFFNHKSTLVQQTSHCENTILQWNCDYETEIGRRGVLSVEKESCNSVVAFFWSHAVLWSVITQHLALRSKVRDDGEVG